MPEPKRKMQGQSAYSGTIHARDILPGSLTCPLKNNGWKWLEDEIVHLKWSLFRGHVSFQGCIQGCSLSVTFLIRTSMLNILLAQECHP